MGLCVGLLRLGDKRETELDADLVALLGALGEWDPFDIVGVPREGDGVILGVTDCAREEDCVDDFVLVPSTEKDRRLRE